MYDVAKMYRIDPYDTFWEEDLGASLNATVVPMLKKSTNGKNNIQSTYHLEWYLVCSHISFVFSFIDSDQSYNRYSCNGTPSVYIGQPS